MATLREVRGRIAGVKKTQKITKAMKMVAAAKLRRAQNAILSARPYASKLQELLLRLSSQVEAGRESLMIPREVKRVALVVVTGDRGLCGGFNSNVIKGVNNRLQEQYPGWNGDGRVLLFCVGKKGWDFFGKRKYTVVSKYLGIFNALSFSRAQMIARDLVQGYLRGDFDRVEVVYNEFKNISQQRVTVLPFLPVAATEMSEGQVGQVQYIYEPSQQQILEAMLPKHLDIQIWRVLLESNAAEQGARMAAMENATVNADEMIRFLQLQYNKARQASITKELLEIVTGAEALSQAD